MFSTVSVNKKPDTEIVDNFAAAGLLQERSGELLEYVRTFHWHKFLGVTPDSLRERCIFPQRKVFQPLQDDLNSSNWEFVFPSEREQYMF